MLSAFRSFICFLTLLSALVTPKTWAQTEITPIYFNTDRIASIDAYIKESMAKSNIPGAAVALIEAGKIVHMQGYGVADTKDTKISSETPFQLASITKSFTSLLILQLEREGKLQLDDSLTSHLPWFKTDKDGQADLITVRHLLQHTSGLSTLAGNQTQNTTYRGDDATERAVKKLLSTTLVSDPGAQFNYSNANYHLATHIIERLEAKPFEQVMATRILQPLGMKNSYVQIPTGSSVKEARGFPHWFGQPIEREFILGRMKMGDGGMVASAEDLAKFLIAIATTDTRLLSDKMRDKLFKTDGESSPNYGLGWQISKHAGVALYEHSGANGGFSSWYGFVDPSSEKNSIGFVILSNSSSALYGKFDNHLRRAILGEKPIPVKADRTNLIFLIALYGGIALLCFAIYRVLFKHKIKEFNLKLLITPIFFLALSYAYAVYVPSLFHITLLGIYPFFPDLAAGLIISSLLSFILTLAILFQIIKRK